MMLKSFPTLILTAAVFALDGCASTSHNAPGQSRLTEDGRYRIAWQQSPPAPIVANHYFEMIVTVDDLHSSSPPQGFRFDATMPAHRHGMNTVVSATRTGDNTWHLQDLNLHMPGEWVMTFDVTDEQGVLHRASETVILE